MKKGCMKIIQSPPQSQQKPQQINDVVHSLCIKQQLLLHYMLSSNTWMRCMYYSQTHLAKKVGVSRKTINEWIALFVELNLIHKWYRQSKTCTYEISSWLLERDTYDWLKGFYRSFFKFSLALMLSMTATSADVTQFAFKGFNLFNCTSTTTQKSTSSNEAKLLYYHDPTWHYQVCTCTGCTTEAVPNKKVTLVEFEAILESTNMSQVLLPFTEEQLVQLAQYPKVSLEYANKLITRDLLGGKTIRNQFNYFVAIVQAHMKHNPQTGKSGASSHNAMPSSSAGKPRQSTFSPYVKGGKWLPGAEIINNDRMFQTTITHVETDIEFAINYEKLIHRLTLMTQEELDAYDPKSAGISMKQRSRYDRNPLWKKFTLQEQQSIWRQAHTIDCMCRKNEDAGLLMPEVADKLSHNTRTLYIKEQYAYQPIPV
jgi:hypothetical protein